MNTRRLAIIFIGGALIALIGTYYGQKTSPKMPTGTGIATPEPSISATPAVREPSTATVTLMFGGDIMLGRTVERRILANSDTWPFDSIASTLSNADLTIVNLESPFRTDAPQTQSGSLVLRGYPPAIKGITKAGVDAVSLANNHITDMGIKGLQETEKILDEAKVGRVGAGPTEADAIKPLIVESRGMKIGMLSFTYGVNFDSAGVFYNDASVERIQKQVSELAPHVDTVIVLCHCGSEYQALPNETQKAWAHTAIDAGASLYIGAHPHVPQPFEAYKDGAIIYSLGNLVFDQDEGGNRDRSALAKFTLVGKKPTALSLIPYQIYDRSQPRLITVQKTKEEVWNLFKLPTGQWP